MKRVSHVPSPPWPAGAWLGGLVVAGCGAWVFRGALGLFFAADDFPALARACGLLPRLSGPWRLLSGQLYFDLMRPLAGLDPLGYHVASLLLHVAGALALYALLRRRLSTPAAMAGAACFVTHPAHFTAVYWVSGVGALLGTVLALATLLAARRTDALRWLAVPLFVAALLARESVVLLPIAAAALRQGEPPGCAARRAPFWRDPLVLVLGAVALAELAHFLGADVMGMRSGSFAYRPDFGRALWANLFSYLGWTANFFLPTVHHYEDTIDPLAYGWGAALLGLWLAGTASARLRRRGWLAGGILYLALLAPVLPLGRHTYHYYLHGALAGFAWCVAAALDALLAWRARGRWRGTAPPEPGAHGWALALLLTTLFTWNGALLVHKNATIPLANSPGLYSDATVDRCAIARNTVTSLRAAPLPEHARLLFWSPMGRAWVHWDDARDSYLETNVRTALFDGLAVRLFLPAVDSVRFVTAYRRLPAPYRYAVYRPDGLLRVADSATLDSVLASHAPAPR